MKNALIDVAALGAAFVIGSKMMGSSPKEVAGTIAANASSAVEEAKQKAGKAASHTKKKASKAAESMKETAHGAEKAVKDVVSNVASDVKSAS